MEIVALNKARTPKERLVNQLSQEIGGLPSYWNKIPVAHLQALHKAIQDNDDAKSGLSNLVHQLQETRQTNLQLNRKSFGVTQTAAKYERVADNLTQKNALLEKQKDELLRQIQNMVSCLTDYKQSEIRQAVQTICKHIGSWMR